MDEYIGWWNGDGCGDGYNYLLCDTLGDGVGDGTSGWRGNGYGCGPRGILDRGDGGTAFTIITPEEYRHDG